MKHTLLVLALAAMVASCGMGGDNARLQKQVDSLTTLLKGRTTNVEHGIRPGDSVTGAVTMPMLSMSDYFMRWDTAHVYIQRWRTQTANNPTLGARTAFLVPAYNLLHLVSPDSQANNAVIFYLGLDSAGMLTLLYEGGNVVRRVTPTGVDSVFAERPVFVDTAGGVQRPQIFDHVYPCPTCDIISTFNSQ